jgi:hypothetical protein
MSEREELVRRLCDLATELGRGYMGMEWRKRRADDCRNAVAMLQRDGEATHCPACQWPFDRDPAASKDHNTARQASEPAPWIMMDAIESALRHDDLLDGGGEFKRGWNEAVMYVKGAIRRAIAAAPKAGGRE